MTPEETAQSYDKLADFWNSDEYNRDYGVPQLKHALRFVKEKRSAIDVGCGCSGRFIEILLEHGFETEGLDISPKMIENVTKRFPELTFHHTNIATWESSKSYDFISAWDSIWHAPMADQESILRKLCSILKNDGILLFTSGGIDKPGERTNPCKGSPLYHAVLGIPKLLAIISECNCICRHLEYDQAYDDQTGEHIYLIVQKRTNT